MVRTLLLVPMILLPSLKNSRGGERGAAGTPVGFGFVLKSSSSSDREMGEDSQSLPGIIHPPPAAGCWRHQCAHRTPPLTRTQRLQAASQLHTYSTKLLNRVKYPQNALGINIFLLQKNNTEQAESSIALPMRTLFPIQY